MILGNMSMHTCYDIDLVTQRDICCIGMGGGWGGSFEVLPARLVPSLYWQQISSRHEANDVHPPGRTSAGLVISASSSL